MRVASDVASIIVGLFLVVLAIFLPLSIVLVAIRRWFWFRLVAGAWAHVEQAKDRHLEPKRSGDRAMDAYRTLRDALLEDANHAGRGNYTYDRTVTLTRISQAATALLDEIPDLKAETDEILRHAKPDTFYDVATVRKWLEPISKRVRRGQQP